MKWHLRIDTRNARHVHAAVLVGSDLRHMVKAGDLVLSFAEQADLAQRLGARVSEREARSW